MATDAQLIERLRTDATGEALRELYRLYSGELFGFTLNALGERELCPGSAALDKFNEGLR